MAEQRNEKELWGRVRDVVETKELFIHYDQGGNDYLGNHRQGDKKSKATTAATDLNDPEASGKKSNQSDQRHRSPRRQKKKFSPEPKWSDLSLPYEFTLRECLLISVSFLSVGVLAYSFVFESWSVVDSLYFTTVLLTTVGYGDMAPSTAGGKLFAIVFALGGVMMLGIALGILGSHLVEAEIRYTEKVKNKTTRTLEKTFATDLHKMKSQSTAKLQLSPKKEDVEQGDCGNEEDIGKSNTTEMTGADGEGKELLSPFLRTESFGSLSSTDSFDSEFSFDSFVSAYSTRSQQEAHQDVEVSMRELSPPVVTSPQKEGTSLNPTGENNENQPLVSPKSPDSPSKSQNQYPHTLPLVEKDIDPKGSPWSSAENNNMMPGNVLKTSFYGAISPNFPNITPLMTPNYHARTTQVFTEIGQVLRRHLPGFVPMIVGTIIFAYFEQWGWIDASYFCVVTATTIGFGDLVPNTQIAKLLAVIFLPVVVAAMGYILGNFATFIVDQRREEYRKRLWNTDLKMEDLTALDMDNDGEVSEVEFIRFMLIAMNKVDGELFDDLCKQFKQFDLTGDGKITKKDLQLMASNKMKKISHKLELSEYKRRLQVQQQKKSLFRSTMKGLLGRTKAGSRKSKRGDTRRSNADTVDRA